MTDIPLSDSLLWEALPDLTLNIAQTAALCGVSVRQLGYWTRQGYVSAQGQGARRTYGLEAVRRVLSVRKAMDGGASLRQALRLVPPSGINPPAPPPPAASAPAAAELSRDEAAALAKCLRSFFDKNRAIRDHAAGLAVKMGRDEKDVQAVADSLCSLGILAKSVSHGMTVFHQAHGEGIHG